ncbi:MAG: hypothetical protein AABW88_02345 [Nanoarchaeota archaeon]
MNYSTSLIALNKNIRVIEIAYDDETSMNPYDKKNNRKRFRTLDKTVKIDDLVVIPTQTRHLMTVAKVVEVDCRVDFKSKDEIQWLVTRVPTEDYANVLAKEEEFIDQLQKSEERRVAEELKKNLLEMHKDSNLENFDIVGMSTPILEHKQAE